MKKIIVITGGAGDIGQAIKKILSGDYTVLTPNKQELDVTSQRNIKEYFSTHKPNILINAAGFIYPQSIRDLNPLIFKRHIDINLTGAVLCSKYAILNNVEKIINISSTAGITGKKDWSAYCISKAGMIMLTKCLHEEGIFAVTLSIGRTATKMRKKLFPSEDISTLMKPDVVAYNIYKILLYDDEFFYYYYAGHNFKIYKKEDKICIEKQ